MATTKARPAPGAGSSTRTNTAEPQKKSAEAAKKPADLPTKSVNLRTKPAELRNKPAESAKTDSVEPNAAKPDAFAFRSASFDSFGPAFEAMSVHGFERGKEALEKFRKTSEEVKDIFAESFDKTRAHAIEMSDKTLQAAENNTRAVMEHAKEVMNVRTVADAIELHSAFMMQQVAALQGQAQAFQDLSIKASQETTEPYKAAFEKSLLAYKLARSPLL